MKSGKIRKIDERADGFNFTFADYKKHVKLAYNQFFGSIIALDEQLVCARREYNGQYTLANMLTRMVDFENFPVEFATGEDMIWRCFLSSQDLQRAPEMRKLLNELNQSSNGMRKSDFIATVINLNIMQMFIELNVLIAADRKRPPINNDFSSFFYAHLLLERLRLLLRPLKPYSPFDSNITGKFRTESVGDLMHVVSFISKDVMNVEAARRLSFYRWPHNNFKHTTSSRMAEAGFYFQPNDGGDDKVICFACSVCLVSWEPDDDPYQEHQRHSPHCKLLTAPLGSINIPFAATMSSLAPLRWNDNIESQHLIINNVDNLIIGMMTSKTSWFAFSDPSSIKPQITLLHLDKVTQAVNSLLIDIFDPFLSNAIGLNLQNITAPVQTLPPIETLNNVIVATQQRRVTWSDEPNEITIEQQQQPPIERIVVLDPNIAEEAFDDDRDEDMVSPGFIEEQEYEEFKQHQPTPHVSISPNHFNKQTVKITSICSASIGNDNEINADDQNSTQQPCVNSSNMDCSADSRSTKISAILFIGITVDEITTNLNKRKEELNTMNVMNPFSVDHNQIISGKRVENVHCPFLLVYHLTETLIPHVDIKSDELKEKEEPMEQSFNKNEERDKDDFSIESTLLAETKKLQEQTAAFSAELVEFLSSEYPNKKPSLLAKYINNNPQDKTSGTIGSAEKIDNTNQVDSTYFDAPLQQSLNPETKVSILYEQKDISTIVMQCFRLPDELNSSHFRIDHIVATENSNGHVVLGVNRITDCVADFSSSIVVYSRMSVVHMLQEICSHKFFFPNVKIAQILLLSIDYFVLYRMQKLNEQKECTHRQTSNKEVKQQLIGSAVLRFTNGQVVLLDLNSGFSVPIFDPKNFEDFQTCADIFLTSSEENTDQIIILTTKGRILCFDVKIPILPSSCVERDEKTFSEFSKALSVASTRSPIGEFHLQKELPEALTYGLLAADDKTFSSLDAFDKLWALTRLHSASTSTQSSSDVNSPCPSSEPSNWNSLLANEIQVHAPTNWVDTTSHRRFRRPITSTLPNLSSSIYLPDNEFESKQKPLGVSHNTRTTWTFSRVDEAIFPAAVANIADQNLVFEFSMPPIIPISHIEISLSSNSQSTSKLPIGGQLSIWLLNNETIERLSTKFKSVSGSFSALHNKQMLLSLLAEKPEIFVEEKAKCVYGPQSLEQLVSCNLKNNTDVFRIRINTCALLLGAADFIDKLQTGWINQPLHFFIHYKPPVSGVNECLNAYKTSTGKSLFLRQQQQTRLLECFGIHRGLASSSDQLITPSTVGSPLKRSYPGCSADSNENGSKSSPPFYYPASSVISSNTGYTPTLFSLCIYFCSTQELS